jgi:hypothetical protein
MAIRVLYRYHGGFPARQATAEENAENMEKIRQTFKKWKASGVKLVGSFHGAGEGVGGYGHYMILDIDDIETLYEMNSDVYSGLGGMYQKHSFAVGLPPIIEEMWESA